jgi:hypothetical protein
MAASLFGQTGDVLDHVRISQTSGNFDAELLNQAKFGFVSARGSKEVLTAAPFAGNGELHLLQLSNQGEVASQSIIKASQFEMFDTITAAEFGMSAIKIGDANQDGLADYLVGAPGYGSSGALLALLSEGSGFAASLIDIPEALRLPGARWGDHLHMAGSRFYSGLQCEAGKVVEFTLSQSLEVQVIRIFDESDAALAPYLEEGDRFGTGIAVVDINGDGIADILCGAPGDDDGGQSYGAVYQLYRNAEGTLDNVVKLSTGSGNFNGFLNSNDDFGISIASLGDLDLDGNIDIAVGAPGDDDGNIDVGAVWIIFLKADGTMKRQRKINLSHGNFIASGLAFDDRFGTRIAPLGDINGDGTMDLAVAAPHKDDGGSNRGAFYTIMMEYCEAPTAIFEYVANGPTVQFSIPGGEGFTYIWNFSDGGYSQEQNPVHTFSSGGTHTVCLTINGPCGGNFYCGPVQVNASSLGANYSDLPGLELFPNPASEYIKVISPEKLIDGTLIDLTGSVVWRAPIGSQSVEIELGQLPRGLYILNLNTAKGVAVRKVQVI